MGGARNHYFRILTQILGDTLIDVLKLLLFLRTSKDAIFHCRVNSRIAQKTLGKRFEEVLNAKEFNMNLVSGYRV